MYIRLHKYKTLWYRWWKTTLNFCIWQNNDGTFLKSLIKSGFFVQQTHKRRDSNFEHRLFVKYSIHMKKKNDLSFRETCDLLLCRFEKSGTTTDIPSCLLHYFCEFVEIFPGIVEKLKLSYIHWLTFSTLSVIPRWERKMATYRVYRIGRKEAHKRNLFRKLHDLCAL